MIKNNKTVSSKLKSYTANSSRLPISILYPRTVETPLQPTPSPHPFTPPPPLRNNCSGNCIQPRSIRRGGHLSLSRADAGYWFEELFQLGTRGCPPPPKHLTQQENPGIIYSAGKCRKTAHQSRPTTNAEEGSRTTTNMSWFGLQFGRHHLSTILVRYF